MALRIRFARSMGNRPLQLLVLRIALIAFASVALLFLLVTGFYYFKYQGIVDERLKQPIFANTAKFLPPPVRFAPARSSACASSPMNSATPATPPTAHRRPRNWAPTLKAFWPLPSAPARSLFTHRTAPPSTSVAALCSPSPTTRASLSPATNSSRCSSPASARTPTAPSAASSHTRRCPRIW